MVKTLKSISNKIYWSALILIASCLLTWAAVELDGDGNGGVDITKGGTNATTAEAARTALGLAIGTDVLAPDGSGANLTSLESSEVEIDEIGTATYDDVQDIINFTGSSGRISGWVLTDGGSGTVDVSAGKGFIRTSDSQIAPLVSFDMSGTTSLALTDNDNNWVYVNYNAGTPIYGVTLDLNTINFNDEFIIGQAYRVGSSVEFITAGPDPYNTPYRLARRHFDISGMQRNTGLVVSEIGTRNLSMTAGSSYYGTTKIEFDAIDTSATGTFTTHYHSSGAWASATGQTAVDYLQYDNGTNLANIGVSKYGVHWVYKDFNSGLHLVYGTLSGSLGDAIDLPLPSSLPDFIQSFSFLIAKIIVDQSDSSNVESVSVAWDHDFGGSVITNHNDSGAIQGGTTDEYYHATAAEYTILGNTSGVNTGDQTIDTIGDAAGAGAVDFVTYLQQWDVGSGSWQVGDGGSNYVQFSTTGITFGGTYSMSANLVSDYVTFTPAATTPSTTDGLLRNVTGLSGIASDTFAFWDGAAIQYLFNYDTLPSVNGAVLTYNASTDDFDWTVPSIPVVASSAEINTGTDNAKFLSADALAGSNAFTKEVSWTIYDSDTDTATGDGKQFFIVPASMNGMNLIDLTVGVHDLNSATGGATTVVLRRVRTNTAVDMTSTGTTVAYNEYYASDETVNTSNDDINTGDRIFPDVDAVTTGAVQKGLSVTALFRLP